VNVHRYPGDLSGSTTYLLDVLADGEHYLDPVNNIKITQISHSDYHATVQVQMDAACVVSAPNVAISPASQSATPGTGLNYTVTVSNADSELCEASTFSLDAVLPDSWPGMVSPDTIYLAPGESQTATLSVSSSHTADSTSYGLTVDVADPAESVHRAAANASYVVEAACAPGVPIVSIAPQSQSAASGAALDYTVSVQNTDSAACPASSFSLGAALPSGWTGGISPANMALAPGQIDIATLSATSPDGTANADYELTVNLSDGSEPLHTTATHASYSVEGSQYVDGEAPSVPSGLTADKKGKNIKLSWDASTDNVGVSGYAVWRDGVRIGDATDTAYVDSTAPIGTAFSYTVSAYDAAGNMSSHCSAVTMGVPEKTNQGKPPKK
jgi:hypothetical protein